MAIPLYDEVNPSRIFPDSKYMKSFTVVLVNDLIGKINAQGAADFAAVWAAINDLDATKIDGPASAVSDNFMIFDGTSGKLAKDSGIKVATTTEVLTGTAINRLVTPDALAALWEGAGTISSLTSNKIVTTEGGWAWLNVAGSIDGVTWNPTAKVGRRMTLRVSGGFPLLVHGGDFQLPGAGNIQTANGDQFEMVCTGGTGTAVIWYQRADGTVLSSALASTTDILTGTNITKAATPDALAALWEKGSNVASAATLSLGEGGYFHITGTTGITDIDFATAKDGRAAWLEFDGILTVTYNATTLVLPGGVSLKTQAGDRMLAVQDSSDNIHVMTIQRAGKRYRLRSITRITGSTTYNTPADIVGSGALLIKGVAGGGGGGGAQTDAANQCGGGGGGYGAFGEAFVENPAASYVVTLGSGGAAGSSSGGNASSGTGTTVGSVLDLGGGGGGGGSTAAHPALTVSMGGSGGIPTTGDFTVRGTTGFYGQKGGGNYRTAGAGASGPYGGGGQAHAPGSAGNTLTGNNGVGYGSGAGGGSGGSGGGAAGGVGAPGYVEIWEYDHV